MSAGTRVFWPLASLVALGLSLAAALTPGSALLRWVAVPVVATVAFGLFRAIRHQARTLHRARAALAGANASTSFEPWSEDDAELALEQAIVRRLGSERSAVEALEVERRRLTGLLDQVQVGLLLVGPQQRIRRANRAACRIFGLDAEPKGIGLAQVIRDPAVLDAVDRLLQIETEPVGGTKLAHHGRAFDVQLAAVSGPPQSPRVLIQLYEISRLENLEAVRRDFVANVSHELRTPLTAIQAAVETLASHELPADPSAPFIAMIQRQTRRMGELIEDLIDLAQIETGAVDLDRTNLDARAVVVEVLQQLQPLADQFHVTVVNELPAPYPLFADRRRLEQMLTNLCHNAIKFNKPGGSVRVAPGDDPGVVRIVDSGIGIPRDSQERIFNRFYRVERSRSREVGGTGLGLAITKHLMALHGGRLQVESELGEGSCFSLVFPEDRPSVSRNVASNRS